MNDIECLLNDELTDIYKEKVKVVSVKHSHIMLQSYFWTRRGASALISWDRVRVEMNLTGYDGNELLFCSFMALCEEDVLNKLSGVLNGLTKKGEW